MIRIQRFAFVLLVLVAGFVFVVNAQNAPANDFFAGKWEISILGSPRGDVKMLTDLVRKNGTLTGELVEADDPGAKRPITKVEEGADKIVLYFESSQSGEISLELAKVDDNNLKGLLMSFEASAKRLK